MQHCYMNIYGSSGSVSVSTDWVQSVAAGIPKVQPQIKIDKLHFVSMKSFSALEHNSKKWKNMGHLGGAVG